MIMIIIIIKGDGSECPVAERISQLQVTHRPAFRVAHGIKRRETSWGCKNPLKFTNGWRERRPGDWEGGNRLSILPEPSKLSSPQMASTPQGIYTIPKRPTATVPRVPYGDSFRH